MNVHDAPVDRGAAGLPASDDRPPGPPANSGCTRFDTAVVGGGIMGCAAALHLAEAGMRVAVFERDVLCAAASGVNAGTLSIQIKRPELVPYALRGLELWRSTSRRLGVDIGLHVRGGLTLAFTEAEAQVLAARTGARREAGAPIELVSPERARSIEPAVTDRIVSASYCAIDSSANASLTGLAYRRGLVRAGVDVRERSPVDRIVQRADGYEVHARTQTVTATHLLLASGAWLGQTAAWLGVGLPVHYRVNQVSVTERHSPLMRVIVSHALGVLTLKQSDNGTVLIGGGWQGRGDLSTARTQIDPANLVGNLRLACFAVPALSNTRLVRSWLGFEAHVADALPIAGPLPARPNAFVLGCVRGGWTIGPYIARLVGDQILGKTPEMPLFDPSRIHAPLQSSARTEVNA